MGGYSIGYSPVLVCEKNSKDKILYNKKMLVHHNLDNDPSHCRQPYSNLILSQLISHRASLFILKENYTVTFFLNFL